ncbi:phospho-acceptor domain-containing protein [Promicromonospora sp. AC04]|uniref:sensor histidine kinase n=1 Tax=Promicromonospora sp. AC04 TaxID=2135723 RepID=UPI000D429AF4|nr:ATP-binding protein [Promicromonospora sp. AC04]PUB31619.1 phospho-acceptor domain-containing protein [Promicromonospora sp. AC04]
MTLVPDEHRFTGVSMRRRLARLLGAVAAMLVLALAVAVLALVQSRGLDARADGPYYRAVVDGERASLALGDAEASLRAYRATCDAAALEPWTRAVGSSGRIMLLADVERRELAADAEVALAYKEAMRLTDAWFDEYAEPVIAAVEAAPAGQIDCRMELLGTAPPAAEGDALYESARAAVVQYLAALSTQRDEIVATRAVWEQLLLGAVATLVLVVVLMGTMMWLALETWVIRPLTTLTAGVRVVSSGVLGREIRPVGAGEVALLAMHVETMRRELVHQVEEIRLSHQEVENAHGLLSEQARELERSNRDLEQFAYVASHDLQEPLRKVASFTQLLQKRYGGSLDERADQYIDFAVDGAKRMQRLIQDLLSFSRVGRTGVPREDVELEGVLTAALSELSDRVAETGAEIVHDPMPTVHGERALLQQLFVNLVGNSLKFRDPDRTPAVRIEVRSMRAHWEISVVDNGIGIDAQYAERVFVIFQRLHPREEYAGTGIGLSLVKRIVEYHKGRIWIEPAAGGGTIVRFTLARRQGQPGPGRLSTERAQSTTLQ